MNQRIKTLGAFVAGAILATAGTAVAGHGGPHGFSHYKLIKDLDLTPEQQALAVELKEAAKADGKAARLGRDAAMDAAMTELAKANPDAARLHRIVDDAINQGRETAHARVDDFLALHATLSDAQRTQLVQGLESMKGQSEARSEMWKERMQERGEGERRSREGRGHKQR